MSAFSGVLTGTLALAVLEAVVTTEHGSRLPEIAKAPGTIARWWVDPTKPLIPDRRSDEVKGLQAQLAQAYAQAAANPGPIPLASTPGPAPSSTPPASRPRLSPFI